MTLRHRPVSVSLAPARFRRRYLASLSSAALCCLLLSACVPPPALPPPVRGPSSTDLRIADSGDRIAKALDQLRRAQAVEAANTGRQPEPPVDSSTAPAPLRLPVVWADWQGPVEMAVRGIAERIGYRVRINGVPPAAPVIIHVDARTETPAITILEDIGLQAGSRANVRVDAAASTIHLYYASPRTGVM